MKALMKWRPTMEEEMTELSIRPPQWQVKSPEAGSGHIIPAHASPVTDLKICRRVSQCMILSIGQIR